MIDLPVVLQRGDFDCGAAVFRSITAYWEGRGRRIRSDAIYGTPPDALESACRAAGYRVLSGEMDVDALRLLTRKGWPVACLVKSGDVGHWVAVAGVRRGRVRFMDPLDGLSSEPAAAWERRWHDFDRRGTVFRRFGMAVWCD